MLNQTKISNALFQAKSYSKDLLNTINSMEGTGEDISCVQTKFITLTQWIIILQEYYDNNFDTSGNVVSVNSCLTLTQILDLLTKLSVMIGDNKYKPASWLLFYGYWDNQGRWENSAVWNNFPTLN